MLGRQYCRLLLLIIFVLTGGLTWAVANRPSCTLSQPKLLVLVVFDQMRGDYLSRWRGLFGPGGFDRLLMEGASFTGCHYPYALTATGPGHASLATGSPPRVHGIIGNGWFDRTASSNVYCATIGDRYQRVPSRTGTGSSAGRGGSPERLIVPTIGDVVKQRGGKVVALSLKDRGAVLLAGRQPDAVYWFDDDDGQFVTSTYYRDIPHGWVREFHQSRPAERWFGQTWRRLRDDVNYDDFAGPDQTPGEGTGVGQGVTFPHPLNAGLTLPGGKYFQALYNSPFANDLLWEFAQAALRGEKLGQDETCDLLCLSFSANDPIGHCWGPDSHEVLDVTLRSDRLMKQVLDTLDRWVGPGQYVLVLSSDHGVVPLPEVSQKQGREAARVSLPNLVLGLEKHLQATLGRGEHRGRWLVISDGEVYFQERTLAAHQVPRRAAEIAAREFLQQQPGVLRVYTRTELEESAAPLDEFGQRFRESFHPERSGDIFVLFKPYWLPSTRLSGTNHGTPHPYDTHVPLVVFGRGVRAGQFPEPITPLAAGVILAEAIGARLPAATVAVPRNIWLSQQK